MYDNNLPFLLSTFLEIDVEFSSESLVNSTGVEVLGQKSHKRGDVRERKDTENSVGIPVLVKRSVSQRCKKHKIKQIMSVLTLQFLCSWIEFLNWRSATYVKVGLSKLKVQRK
jgi:hypothetical protein